MGEWEGGTSNIQHRTSKRRTPNIEGTAAGTAAARFPKIENPAN